MGYYRTIDRNANMREQYYRTQNVRQQSAGGQYSRPQNVRPQRIENQGGRPRNAGLQSDRPQNRVRTGTRSAAAQRELRKRRRRRRQALGFLKFAVCLFLLSGILATVRGGISLAGSLGEALGMGKGEETGSLILPEDPLYADEYGERLAELLEKNQEAEDYVKCYPDREKYMSQPIDLTEDLKDGDVPLLMQWDKRWGYNAYGSNMIGLAGCGPVCLTMAYLHFTGDTSMTPREMAAFVDDNGYYEENAGTKWTLWTEGVGKLGLSGRELPLDQSVMEQALDDGCVVVCSMGPGDFTTDGHFILIRGYDENGFYVNDPNRRSNSDRQWDFETLRGQIRNLWSLGQ